MVVLLMLLRLLLSTAILSACASFKIKDEDRHDPPMWASMLVQRKASFDFDCKAEQLPVVRAVSYLVFAARGCGHKATYTCEDKAPWYRFAEFECKLDGNITALKN